MSILPLFGHSALRARLDAALRRGSLPGSLLLYGASGIGKQRLALWIGQRLLCEGPDPRPCGTCQHCRFALRLTHPDLHWFFPRPRLKDSEQSLDQIRADYTEAVAERAQSHGLYAPPGGDEGIFVATVRVIVQIAARAPALGRRKVFVIGDAERMVPQESAPDAANAFLKLLEEPPENTNIILTSSEPGALLPTIRSRVTGVRVAPLGDEHVLEFMRNEHVRTYLEALSLPPADDDRLARAGGAPGRLLAQAAWDEAQARARRILDAALHGDRRERMRVALMQGGARARGAFSEGLDALTTLLRDRTREALDRADERAAAGAAGAVAAVEQAKEHADRNANPQLITLTLLRELEAAIR